MTKDNSSSVQESEHVESRVGLDAMDISTTAAHDGRPIWEQRETYGKAGFAGVFSNKYVTACAAFATLGGALFGYDQGVISVTLVMDHFLDKFPEVSPDAAGSGFKKGLMTAMIELGAFLGAMNVGWIADKFSRKRTIMIAVLIFLFGSGLQTGAMTFSMLVGGRFVGGIGVGMLSTTAPVYISEMAPPEIRGTLLVLQELSITTAIVVAFFTTYGTRFIDSEWSWRLPFLIQMAPAILLGIGIPFLPYSPRWLGSRGRDEEVLQTLSKIRGFPTTDPRVMREYAEILSEVQYRNEVSKERHPKLHDGRVWSRIKLQIVGYTDCFGKSAWRRTHVGIGLMFFQQFVGVNALIYYAPSLFETMGLGPTARLNMAGILNVIQMVATIWSLWGLDRFGRRPLLLVGSVCMSISHFVIALLVGLYSGSWETHKAEGWISTAFLMVFMSGYAATWGPIPWAMPAEIFPASLRAKGMAYTSMSNWFNNFIIGLITPPLIQKAGFGTYIFFGVFAILSGVWTYFVVPETNGRTLEQMDDVFKDNTAESEAIRRARIEGELLDRVFGRTTISSDKGAPQHSE